MLRGYHLNIDFIYDKHFQLRLVFIRGVHFLSFAVQCFIQNKPSESYTMTNIRHRKNEREITLGVNNRYKVATINYIFYFRKRGEAMRTLIAG